MTDLVERVAKSIHDVPGSFERRVALAAITETLEAMREFNPMQKYHVEKFARFHNITLKGDVT